MRKVIKKYRADEIYLATDDDREGEAIAWHICQVFGLPVETTKRIVFHEITKPALERAVASPCLINMNIVKAQQTRQVLDLMVGFKVSPLLWKYLYRNKDNSLSAGRCQTPALRLVYDNAMEKCEVKQTYKIVGVFYPKKIEFELSRELATKEEVVCFLEASKTFLHKFSMGKKKMVETGPPRPFTTSRLLQFASSTLKMSPKEVMSGCQQLYQDGYITYMRTDAQTYCLEFLREIEQWIKGVYNEKYVGNLGLLENRDAGNPHEAIRVTHIEMKTVDGVSGRVARLYHLIWNNTVASCMSVSKVEQTPLYMTSPLSLCDKPAEYVHIVEVPVFLGWKTIEGATMDAADTGSALCLYVESCPKEQSCKTVSARVVIHGRRNHYTEATLIKKMEEIGIGRPSTYAFLVDTIIERGYVKKTDIEGETISVGEYVLYNEVNKEGVIKENSIEKKVGQEKGKLVIQPVGVMVAEYLTEHFGPLFAYDYTKEMETDLDSIAQGMSKKDLCEDCNAEIEGLIKPVEKQQFVLKDTDEYIVIIGRYGPVIQKKGSREYVSMNKNVDMERMKRGDYSLAELRENKDTRELGEYEGYSTSIRLGPYGQYICYRDNKIGLKSLGIEGSSSTDEEVFAAFAKYMKRGDEEGVEGREGEELPEKKDSKIIRELTEDMSIRNGKYGAYIHYQRPEMKKPKFYTLKGFKESYRLCQKEVLLEWVKTTYNV
jgi:DNA topoisomerase-1